MSWYEDLQARSIEDLKSSCDRIAKTTSVGLDFYLDEIRRRESQAAERKMLGMTKQMKIMTIAIVILTTINVVAVIAPLLVRI